MSDHSNLISDDRKRLRLERPFAREVRAEKNRFIRAANDDYRMFRSVQQLTIEEHKGNMRKVFRKRYGQVVREFGGEMKSLSSIGKMLRKQDEERDFFEDILRAYLAAYGLSAVDLVVGTGLRDFQAFALSAYGEGLSNQEIEKMLRSQFGISAWRSATIARTEVGKVSSFAQTETVRKASIDTGATFTKKWIPFLDERTRENHAVMNSKPAIDMDAKFRVGADEMDRPRDPNAGAGNVINCRCTLVFEEV